MPSQRQSCPRSAAPAPCGQLACSPGQGWGSGWGCLAGAAALGCPHAASTGAIAPGHCSTGHVPVPRAGSAARSPCGFPRDGPAGSAGLTSHPHAPAPRQPSPLQRAHVCSGT